jgi:hypothetical protein
LLNQESIRPDEQQQPVEVPTIRSSARIRIGLVLIGMSGILWFSMCAVPFLSIATTWKAALAASLFAGVQITWWTGAGLAGPHAIKTIKTRFTKSL